MTNKEKKLQRILDQAVDQKKIFGTSFCAKHQDFTWCGTSGNFQPNDQYFIASTTKLFVTAIILQLHSEGHLTVKDSITNYLPEEVWDGLHVLDGKDYSEVLTIKNLLAHTSGIPDYFQQKDDKGSSLEQTLMAGNDQAWSFEETVALSKSRKPLFIPNQRGKAHYSDTNFQLLGRIIEVVTQKSIAAACEERIIQPLGLTKTYLYHDATDKNPKPLYYKAQELNIPKAMTSFGPDGGMVSTSPDMLRFIEAFFTGALFPASYLSELQAWNSIYFPIQSGVGIQRVKLPWVLNPFGTIPDLLGHSGLSGALAFGNHHKGLFVAGTVNQVASPSTSFRLMIKLIQQLLKNT